MHYPEAFIQDCGSELTYLLEEFVREDEFTRHGCNLILHRTLPVDEEHSLCRGARAKCAAGRALRGGIGHGPMD